MMALLDCKIAEAQAAVQAEEARYHAAIAARTMSHSNGWQALWRARQRLVALSAVRAAIGGDHDV